MKRLNKNAIKRGQSRTCLNYAECKHFGRSQTKGMYALLITVAAVIGITIYVSCSADEDYDGYSDYELSTRAEREMSLRSDAPPMTCRKTDVLTGILRFYFIDANIIDYDTLSYRLETCDYVTFNCIDTLSTDPGIKIDSIITNLIGRGNDGSYKISTMVYATRFIAGIPKHDYDEIKVSLEFGDFQN